MGSFKTLIRNDDSIIRERTYRCLDCKRKFTRRKGKGPAPCPECKSEETKEE